MFFFTLALVFAYAAMMDHEFVSMSHTLTTISELPNLDQGIVALMNRTKDSVEFFGAVRLQCNYPSTG
jgi:hypothetical protein